MNAEHFHVNVVDAFGGRRWERRYVVREAEACRTECEREARPLVIETCTDARCLGPEPVLRSEAS